MNPLTKKSELAQGVPIPSSEHYDAIQYLKPWRMASIGYQFHLAEEFFPAGALLEVGVGSGLGTYLLRQLGRRVATLDIEPTLRPDAVGSILRIPLPDGALGAFLCFQVLEHLPWSDVGLALSELRRVTQHGGVISVPTCQPTWLVMKYDSRSWGTRRVRLGSRTNKPMRGRAEHHWELEANVSARQFEEKIRAAGLEVAHAIQPAECMYHQFYVLKRR